MGYLMGWLRALADNRDARSWAHRLRVERFAHFLQLIREVGEPFRVLDIGGTPGFWNQMGFAIPPGSEIVLLNLGPPPANLPDRLRWVAGDATDLSCFSDREFSVAFSNSVIEHLGSLERQRCMAREVQRVAERHYIQTPNYWFLIEPHFLLPGVHWLPKALRARVIHKTRAGWYGRHVRSIEDAVAVVESISLLRLRELRDLFPGSRIVVERWLGMSKSFIAIGAPPPRIPPHAP